MASEAAIEAAAIRGGAEHAGREKAEAPSVNGIQKSNAVPSLRGPELRQNGLAFSKGVQATAQGQEEQLCPNPKHKADDDIYRTGDECERPFLIGRKRVSRTG